MGTSASIRVQKVDYVEFYKHYDGYPEETLPWLKEFNERFVSNRGIDPSYKMAQLVRSSYEFTLDYDLDPSLFTGWGLVPYNSVGVNYIYTLMDDGSVKVQKV
jgi:hypothetical protein